MVGGQVALKRGPQSVQSVPCGQIENSAPGPPSSAHSADTHDKIVKREQMTSKGAVSSCEVRTTIAV